MAMRATEIVQAVDATWIPFRRAVNGLGDEGLGRPTATGWTVKEMVAHVAFWDEAVVGVVLGMFRTQALPDGWAFGSGYLPAEGERWPSAEEHNAREAEWARGHTGQDAIARLDHAHQQLVTVLSTVTDSEASDHAAYFSGLGSHYDEHLPELAGLGASPRASIRSCADPGGVDDDARRDLLSPLRPATSIVAAPTGFEPVSPP